MPGTKTHGLSTTNPFQHVGVEHVSYSCWAKRLIEYRSNHIPKHEQKKLILRIHISPLSTLCRWRLRLTLVQHSYMFYNVHRFALHVPTIFSWFPMEFTNKKLPTAASLALLLLGSAYAIECYSNFAQSNDCTSSKRIIHGFWILNGYIMDYCYMCIYNIYIYTYITMRLQRYCNGITMVLIQE